MVDQRGQAFRPRARLLQLLGDQLIGTPRLALFELVKNAYDAQASFASVEMLGLGSESATIAIRDDGTGMSETVIRNIWLVPGHDHRQQERIAAAAAALRESEDEKLPPAESTIKDTHQAGRLPLGEKGLGRFAVHKLGNRIELITRAFGEPEVLVEIDWDRLTAVEFLDQGLVSVETREPVEFQDQETGTLIKISDLRGEPWTRGEVRRLARQITSISSPFRERSDKFDATLDVPEHPDWLAGVATVQDLIRRAPFTFEFSLEDNLFSWNYEFKGLTGIGANPRSATDVRPGVLLDPAYLPKSLSDQSEDGTKKKPIVSPEGFQDGIGKIAGTLYVFDRDREVLQRTGDSQGVQSFLDENGGVRVYRDGIRVYNYGEPGDDWLGLDLRRVNAPSKRVSNNIVVGSIDLTLSESMHLREKTNREGFDENEAYARLRALVMGAVATFELERQVDKDIVRKLLKKSRSESDRDIAKPLRDLARLAKKNGFAQEIQPLITAAQSNYDDMRDIMLRAGTSNMTLAIVFHEIDHGVRLLYRSVEDGATKDQLLPQTRELIKLLDGFGDLLRRGDVGSHSLRELVDRAIELNRIRLRNHQVSLQTNVQDMATDPSSEFPMGLVLGAITNVIDNSVYWLRTKWPDEAEGQHGKRKVYVGVDEQAFSDGPAVIIADNGPGFLDDLGDITKPFFSRRPDGIGIGLYYVSMIMELSGGRVEQLAPGDAGLPEQYDGAALALVFSRSK